MNYIKVAIIPLFFLVGTTQAASHTLIDAINDDKFVNSCVVGMPNHNKDNHQTLVLEARLTDPKDEFIRLAEIAMHSESRTDTAQAGHDFVRLGIKAICACTYVYISNKFNDIKLDLIPAAALLLWNRANFKYDKGDMSLISLQALETYLDSLNTEQKQALSALFKDKYATALRKKISKEKGDRIASIIQALVAGLDLVAPALLIKKGVTGFIAADNTNKACIGFTSALCATDMLQILTNSWYSMNHKKDLTLRKIEEALS